MLPKVKRIFVIALTLTSVVFGWIGYGILRLFYPDEYSPCFPLIPLFFYVFGLAFICLFEYMHKHMREKSALVYVVSRGAKLAAGLIFLVICGFFTGITKVFILAFFAYYIAYLIFESCFFFRYEMKMKKVNKKK